MKLFKTPTRDASLYGSEDADALRNRVRELEEVVERYRTKRVGPYELEISIKAPTWPDIIRYLRWHLNIAERSGPDGMNCAWSDSACGSGEIKLKSNTVGGPGETDADVVSTSEPAGPPCQTLEGR